MSRRSTRDSRRAARPMGTSTDAPANGPIGGETKREMQQPTPPEQRVSDLFAEVMRDVPDEELAKLPPDWSENHDHYLHGTPKKR